MAVNQYENRIGIKQIPCPFCPLGRKVTQRPLFTIKKLLRNILFFPSRLCLDAPLVAIVWVATLRNLSSGNSISLAAVAGLGFSIWGIYLFDRLFDVRSGVACPHLSNRHRFTSKHPKLFRFLIGCAFAGCLACLPFVPSRILLCAGGLAAVTFFYYGIFRFFRPVVPSPVKAPWKELTIAITFVAGIFLCLWPVRSPVVSLVVGMTLLLLFLSNCLKIALAESDLDEQCDQAGFYSESKRGASVTLLALPLVALVFSIAVFFFDPSIGFALSLTSLLCLYINSSRRIPVESVQAVSDLALLFPASLLLAGQLLLSR